MPQPQMPDPTTVPSGAPAAVPLKVASLASGIPILFLGQELGSQGLIVFLTLLFYLSPYVLIAVAPPPRRHFQVGFAAGYAFAMIVVLLVYFVARSLGAPTSTAIVSLYGLALLFNLTLFAIAVITWTRLRKSIDNGATTSMLFTGLVFPFVGFVVVAIFSNIFLP